MFGVYLWLKMFGVYLWLNVYVLWLNPMKVVYLWMKIFGVYLWLNPVKVVYLWMKMFGVYLRLKMFGVYLWLNVYVSSNALLAKADPNSIYQAAALAATLDLPLNNSLGFAYIIPFA